MGASTWMKYIALVSAFAGIGTKVFSWLKKSQAAGSPGGEDITPEEIPALQDVITDAVNTGLQAGEVPLVATVTLAYIGD